MTKVRRTLLCLENGVEASVLVVVYWPEESKRSTSDDTIDRSSQYDVSIFGRRTK